MHAARPLLRKGNRVGRIVHLRLRVRGRLESLHPFAAGHPPQAPIADVASPSKNGLLSRLAGGLGAIRLVTSVASHGGHVKRLHVDQAGDDSNVDKTGPFWTEVKVLGADGKPSLDYPLKDGYFEITLPAAMLGEQPKTITLAWIDFYRR